MTDPEVMRKINKFYERHFNEAETHIQRGAVLARWGFELHYQRRWGNTVLVNIWE